MNAVKINRLERTYPASATRIWELWTTAPGIESWWAPDGFRVDVSELDVRPGGALRYAMTATGEGQIAFMESAGMPLTTESSKTFTEVEAPTRLAYDSLVDFVPDVAPYSVATTVELTETSAGTEVVMTVESLHDDVWTERLLAGRANELDNLGQVLGG
jgi:uncharacterized protein YndB with AHSA1/START domain